MTDFLVFSLYGPMSSWGDVAVGEFRPSSGHPTRSALMGFLAAALGLDRQDQTQHDRLNHSVYFAVCVDQQGVYLRDYQTVQFPSGKAARDQHTRKQELEYPVVGALQTQREYLCDAAYTVCLWSTGQGFALEQLADALKQPCWQLFLGRKACPLGAPLRPEILEAKTMKDALDQYQPVLFMDHFNEQPALCAVYWDASAPDVGLEPLARHQRRDVPGARLHARTFGIRYEHFAHIDRSISCLSTD